MVGVKQLGLTFFLSLMFVLNGVLAQTSAGEWIAAGGDAANTKYSRITSISPENAAQLYQDWFLPIPPSREGSVHGVTHPLLIKYGVGYAVTNSYLVISFDMRGGKIFWTIELLRPNPLHPNILPERLAHIYQAMLLKSGGDELLAIGTSWQRIYLLDAFTGRLAHTVDLLGQGENVEGNMGKYGGIPVNFAYDSRRGILIVGASVPDSVDAGRGFIDGYSVSRDGVRRIWRAFLMPPQTQYSPEWSLNLVRKAVNAWLMDGDRLIDLKALDETTLNNILLNDWSASGGPPRAGVMASWMNGWAVDEMNGVVYVGTSSPSPSLNAGGRTGPNLPSSSLMAIKVETGEVLWIFQAIPHDIWGHGCNGGVTLFNDLVLALCGNGVLYALNKNTGRPVWMFRPPALPASDPAASLSPLNKDQMAIPYLGQDGKKIVISPPPQAILSFAVNPLSGRIFYAIPVYSEEFTAPPQKTGKYASLSKQSDLVLYSIESATGRIVWEKKFENIGSGFLSAASNLLFLTSSAGLLYILSEKDGGIVYSRQNIGTTMTTPSIGVDVEGNPRLLLSFSAVDDPGYMISLRLLPLGNESFGTAVVTEHTTITRTATLAPDLRQPWSFGLMILILAAAAASLTMFWLSRSSKKSQSGQTG
jgi:outer membrane protein assembly factor BamB